MRRAPLPLLLLLLLAIILLYALRGSSEPLCSCCYLTDVDPERLRGRRFDVLILEMEGLNPSAIGELRRRCRLLLAYINLGYAEEWRDYWSEIGGGGWVHEPTEYEGEYFVEYWRPEWRDVILTLVEEAHGIGFEGVLLDNVDASTTLRELRPTWSRGLEPEESMINLVEEVSRAAKQRYGVEFKVYVNLGSALRLLGDERFLSSIDGILREELWHTYGDGGSLKTPREEAEETLRYLREARGRGKTILVADPLESGEEAEEFRALCLEEGFKPIPQPSSAWDYSRPPPRAWCSR
ncbi:MAG: hypothetical protein AYL28_000740 [Candidatus Bathyarchaeota archaeon B23]|nr:MAG: hypothetical protein AYL28_000740 [Candidatus Bathyarchaeota archaeon B23]